ncbi:MAG TPA: hypothetical protein PL067_11160 [Bacteroidales bacterium]|nr:hypothetical protein [Candidatus Fermentibacter daniensis]HPO41263.1 hypothetical protein [Bacteroidales bacterium]
MTKARTEESTAWANAERYSREYFRLIEVQGNGISERDPWACAQIQALISLTIESLLPAPEVHAIHSLVRRTLHKLAVSGLADQNPACFTTQFRRLLGDYSNAVPEVVRILTFLHLKPELSARLGRLSWKGLNIQVLTWDEVSSLVKDFGSLLGRVHRETGVDFNELRLPWHFVPLSFHVRARSVLEVSNLAEETAEPLRGCINFVLGAGTMYYSFDERKPPAECMAYPMMLMLNEDGSYRNVSWPRAKAQYKDSSFISEKKIESAARVHSRLGCLPDRRREVATGVLLKWQKALDCADEQLSYLFLWQAIEAAALQGISSQFLPAGTVVDRVARLVRARRHERDLLLGLADERGRIAHHGNRSESLELYLNVLKLLVERCFSGMVASRRVKSFSDLLRLYDPDENP